MPREPPVMRATRESSERLTMARDYTELNIGFVILGCSQTGKACCHPIQSRSWIGVWVEGKELLLWLCWEFWQDAAAENFNKSRSNHNRLLQLFLTSRARGRR